MHSNFLWYWLDIDYEHDFSFSSIDSDVIAWVNRTLGILSSCSFFTTSKSIDSSTAIFDVPRRNFSSGSFKVVVQDDHLVIDRSARRLMVFGLVSESWQSSLVNSKPLDFCLAWSSSKVRVVRLGLSALDGSCFLHDVHIHQTVRIKITPHNVPIIERVGTPEFCKHMNPNAIRKDIMLSRKHETWFINSQTEALTPTSAMHTASWTWSLRFLGQAKDVSNFLSTLAEKGIIGGQNKTNWSMLITNRFTGRFLWLCSTLAN